MPTGIVQLNSSSAQYTTTPNDALIEVDISGGALAGAILFEAAPILNTKHTIKNTAGDASTTPILVNGNGQAVEDPNMPGGVQTYASTNIGLKVRGGAWTWQWDGTNWIEVV